MAVGGKGANQAVAAARLAAGTRPVHFLTRFGNDSHGAGRPCLQVMLLVLLVLLCRPLAVLLAAPSSTAGPPHSLNHLQPP